MIFKSVSEQIMSANVGYKEGYHILEYSDLKGGKNSSSDILNFKI